MSEHSIHVAATHWFGRLTSLLIALALIGLVNASGLAQAPAPPAPNGLPPKFVPPRPIPEVMLLEDELITFEEYEKWRKTQQGKFVEALKAQQLAQKIPDAPQQPGGVAQKLIDEGIRIKVGRLSLKSERNRLTKARPEVAREVHAFASKATREYALKKIVEESQKLLKGNFHVRIHTLMMLSELELAPAIANKNPPIPAVTVPDSFPVFLQVLRSEAELEAVRITAAASLKRVLKDSQLPTNPPNKFRIDVAKTVVPILQQAKGGAWFQRALIDVLVEVNLANIPEPTGGAKPEIPLVLAQVVSEDKRPISVRSHAVRALGKAPLPAGGAGLDTAKLAKSILGLSEQIATDFNAALAAGQNTAVGAIWYLFQMETTYEGLTALKTSLPNDKNTQATYSAVLPVARHMIQQIVAANPAPVPQKAIDGLKAAAKGI